MEKTVVEVGMKIDKDFKYYDKMLKRHGLKQVFSCITHDVYYTKEKSFHGLSENQIKNACVRIRNPKESDRETERRLVHDGYYKVFDTSKKDFHYKHDSMKSCVQLQDIEGLGLVVYYDNPDYYHLPAEEQRILLLKELNTYGFSFREDELGIDKLKTLYYGQELFSENQNG